MQWTSCAEGMITEFCFALDDDLDELEICVAVALELTRG
jgi:hypothetical protein